MKGTGKRLVAVFVAALACLAPAVSAGATAGARASGVADRDRDGMSNRWERAHRLNPSIANGKADPDGDHLSNVAEFRLRTRPHRADSDTDGLKDGIEVRSFGTDPGSRDSNHDGIWDGNQDNNGDGILDEGQDHDGKGFVGVVALFDAATGLLMFESAAGMPMAVIIVPGTIVRFDASCGNVSWTQRPQMEGLDVMELYLRDTKLHGLLVVQAVKFGCPLG